MKDNSMLQISVSELRAATDVMFRHLDELGVQSVTLDKDYYWDIPAGDRYDRHEAPTDHTLGQLSYDVEQVKGLADGSGAVIAYGFVWLAAVLRRVGETTVG